MTEHDINRDEMVYRCDEALGGPYASPEDALRAMPGLDAAASAIALAKLAIAHRKAFGVYFPDVAEEMADLASAYLLENGVRYWISPMEDSITCVKCRHASHNPNDVKNRYCGFCHEFLNDAR